MTFHIQLKNDLPVSISDTYDKTAKNQISSRDYNSFADAAYFARLITELTNKTYIAVDNGEYRFNRYEIIRMYQVGEEVSYTFNGDTYPDDIILEISKDLSTIKTANNVYKRVKETRGWKQKKSPFWLFSGHLFEQNPSF